MGGAVIAIVNRRTYNGLGVYVGRPSPLGNPFHIGTDGTRAEVIAKYRLWLTAQLEDEFSPASRELRRLCEIAKRSDLTLICWCVPLSCHAEVIKRAIDDRIGS